MQYDSSGISVVLSRFAIFEFLPARLIAPAVVAAISTASTGVFVDSSAVLAAPARPAGPARAESVFLKLEQQSCTRGKMNVYVSKDAIFIDCIGRGYFIVCKAPDWKMVMYSPQTKRYYEADRKTWMHSSQVNLMDLLSTKINAMKVEAAQPGKFLKQNVTLMKMHQVVNKALREEQFVTGNERGFYYVTDDFKVPQQVGDVVVWLYKLPPMAPARGVPLKFTYIDASKQIFTSLNTLTIEKVNFDTKKLVVPTGYEKASTEALVVVDKSREGDLEELWGVRSSGLRGKSGAR